MPFIDHNPSQRPSRRPIHRLGRLALAAMGAAAVGLAAGLTPIAATGVGATPQFDPETGIALDVFTDRSAWRAEQAWVEVPGVDSDRDGLDDLVHVDVVRQGETETDGLKVPIILQMSPYFAGTTNVQNHSMYTEVGQDPPYADEPSYRVARPTDTSTLKTSGSGANQFRYYVATAQVATWVPRGFAVAHAENLGAGWSTGCPSTASLNEQRGVKAAVEWLAGKRGTAYSDVNRTATVPLPAWSAGKVAMLGTSYPGIDSMMAAAQNAEGLAAIAPDSSITSWYDYYRANGAYRAPAGYPGEDTDTHAKYNYSAMALSHPALGHDPLICEAASFASMVAQQDRASGNYTPYFAERDLVATVPRWNDIGIFLTAGFRDWNNQSIHMISLLEAIKADGRNYQMYLHQRGHGQQTAPDAVQNAFFTHYLYGGAPSGGEQKVWAYSSKYLEATGTVNWNNVQPEVLPDWPPAGTEDVTLKLGPATGREEAGTMTFAAGGDALTAETFTDQTHPQVTGLDYGNGTSADVPYAEYPAVAGTGAAAGRTVEGHRLVYLSDEIGQDFRIAGAPKVKLNFALTNRTKANLSVILVSYPKAGTAINGSAVNTAPQIVTRGWADPQNRTSLTYDEPVEQGTFYDISFATDPKDYTFTAGSRLALVVMSTDPGFTIRPADGAQLAIKPALSSVTFPVVGGLGALAAANPGGTIPTSVLGIALGVYSLYESQESRYTPESYAPFAAALAEARAIAEWGFAPRETIDTAAAAVESAARNLVEAVDTSVLDSFIASARAILADPSNHVAANLPALRAALDAAVVARAGGGLTQAQATAAAIALATALANVHPKGDRTGLTGLITVADGLESARYTPATWDAMAVALAAARPVAANPEASVDDVETAFTALRASLDALVLRAAKAGLASAIAVAEAMAANLPAYHPASVAGLEAAAAQARAVQADLDASTQAVTAAQAALVQVIAGARLKSAETLAAAAGAGPAELATAKPKIAGRAEVGRRLRAKAGAWSPKPALSYQWYRNGAAIPKAVKASYKVKRADAGKRLTVKVTGAKPGYAAATRAAAAKKVRRL